MTRSISRVHDSSPIAVAAGFVAAFIVGSLAVQMIRSQTATVPSTTTRVEPVLTSPAALWSVLGERELASSVAQPAAAVSSPEGIKPVVPSEATLWSTLGER